MKIRKGFVSNSSSSSFVIATKEGFIEDKIKKHFAFKKNHPFEEFLERVSQRFTMCSKPLGTYCQEEMEFMGYTKEEIDEDEIIIFARKLEKRGFDVYVGHFSDEGEGCDDQIECFLRGTDFDINKKDLIIKKF